MSSPFRQQRNVQSSPIALSTERPRVVHSRPSDLSPARPHVSLHRSPDFHSARLSDHDNDSGEEYDDSDEDQSDQPESGQYAAPTPPNPLPRPDQTWRLISPQRVQRASAALPSSSSSCRSCLNYTTQFILLFIAAVLLTALFLWTFAFLGIVDVSLVDPVTLKTRQASSLQSPTESISVTPTVATTQTHTASSIDVEIPISMCRQLHADWAEALNSSFAFVASLQVPHDSDLESVVSGSESSLDSSVWAIYLSAKQCLPATHPAAQHWHTALQVAAAAASDHQKQLAAFDSTHQSMIVHLQKAIAATDAYEATSESAADADTVRRAWIDLSEAKSRLTVVKMQSEQQQSEAAKRAAQQTVRKEKVIQLQQAIQEHKSVKIPTALADADRHQVEIERAEKTLQTYHAALLNAREELSSALAHEQKLTSSVAKKESAATAALAAKRREMYWREQVDAASTQLSSILQAKPMMKAEQLRYQVQQWRDELKSLQSTDSEHATSLSEVIANSKSQFADAETAVTVCERRWNWAKDMAQQQVAAFARARQEAKENVVSAHSEPGQTFDAQWFTRKLHFEVTNVAKSVQRLKFARQHASTIGARACPK